MALTKADPGALLLQHGYAEEALPLLERRLSTAKDKAGPLVNLAIAHRHLGQFEEAMAYVKDALRAARQLPNAWNEMGAVFEDLGQFEDALDAYYAAWSLAPTNQDAALSYAYALLRMERFEEGWPLWCKGTWGTAWRPIPGIPILDRGEDVKGKRILIHKEGGYGDGIMYARWFPELQAAGAVLTFLCWKRLAPLFCGWPWLDRVLPDDHIIDINDYDFQVPLMDLPAVLGMKSMADIPQVCPYIDVDPAAKQQWAKKLNWRDLDSSREQPRRIGLCWRAEENGTVRKVRSIPTEVIAPLAKIKADWFSLCPRHRDLYNDYDEACPIWLIDATEEADGWGPTAALIANLDLVITVDTAVAHLAGAMDVPVWCMIPVRSEWKWLRGEGQTLWYPSMRVLRNTDPLRWESMIARVAQELEALS